MRNGIVEHDVNIDASNASVLEGMDFAFICIDSGEAKVPIIEKLEELGTPFVVSGQSRPLF